MLTINQEVINIVSARYEILDIIDLYQYDYQIDRVDELLSKYKNHTFSKTQRILILHHDTDYYINNTLPGFTLYNLCFLLAKNQIPHEFLIMFTNHYGIEAEVSQLSAQLCNSKPFNVIYTALWIDYPSNVSVSSTTFAIENLFCVLNGIGRSHRILTLCYLKEHNLLDKGAISYHFICT